MPIDARALDVTTPSPAFRALMTKWQLVSDLLGGTEAMRAAGKRWLPKEPKEKDQAYAVRLQRSFLFNAFGNAVENITARPFTRDIILKGEMPEEIKAIEKDADLMGTSLTRFGRSLFQIGVAYGCGGVLVDQPQAPQEDNAAMERASGRRPYFIAYQPWQVLGYRQATTVGGYALEQVRLLEETDEPSTASPYATNRVRRIRVYNTESWELWQEDLLQSRTQKHVDVMRVQLGAFKKIAEGTHTFGGVPFYPFVTKAWDRYYGQPPLEDLAWMNVAHWQSYSDQRGILRVVRVPILGLFGFTAEEIPPGTITIGPWHTLRSENPQARAQFAEHSGAAVASGRQDLVDLEDKMTMLGMKPLLQKTGDMTATEVGINEARSQSDVIDWVHACEHTLLQCFKAAFKWLGLTMPADFEVDINDDIAVRADATDLQALQTARATGEISRKTFLFELQRRGVLNEAFDQVEDAEELSQEVPAGGGLPGEEVEEGAPPPFQRGTA